MSDLERGWDEIKEKWREMKSGVTIRTISGAWDALELLARKHDHEFFDPEEAHSEAIKQLFTREGNRYLPVIMEVMRDKSYHWLTRVYALQAASMTKHEYVRKALRELVDSASEEVWEPYMEALASALYRQGDFEYLEKLSLKTHIKGSDRAKRLLEDLSWRVDREWCPYLDEHGVCLKKSAVRGCDNLLLSGAVRDHVGKVITPPTHYDWRRCPEITISRWPAQL